MRYQRRPAALPTVLPVANGGTGATTAAAARANLGMLASTALGQPSGVAQLDAQGKLSKAVFQGLVPAGNSVQGPTSITINQVQTYSITDYDSFMNYTLAAIAGIVTRSGDTITYTGPTTPQNAGFTLNGRDFAVTITQPRPAQPTISSPTSGSTNVGNQIGVIASAFVENGDSATHENSDWQIASDANFTTIVQQSLADGANKTQWVGGGVFAVNTTYYIRCRYRATNGNASDWSATASFTTKANFNNVSETGFLTATSGCKVTRFFNNGNSLLAGGNGAVRLYDKVNGSWTLVYTVPKTFVVNFTNSNVFGFSSSITQDGTRIVIGAHDVQYSGKNSGGILVLVKSGASYVTEYDRYYYQEEPSLADTDIAEFGRAVAISDDGSIIAVSAPGYGTNAGYIYVYRRTGSTWAFAQKFRSSNVGTRTRFGYSMRMSRDGQRIMCSSYEDNTNGSNSTGMGCVFSFYWNGSAWQLETTLKPSSALVGSNSIATTYYFDMSDAADRIAMIVYLNGSSYGNVYVYKRTGNSWAVEGNWTPTPANINNGGLGMSGDGSTVMVGYPSATVAGVTLVGSFDVYTRNGVTWSVATQNNASATPTTQEYTGGENSCSINYYGSRFAAGSWYGSPGRAHIFE